MNENYWILTTPRTGSNRLCQLLNNTGLFEHYWEEYLNNEYHPDITKYFNSPLLLLNNYNKLYCNKVHYYQLRQFCLINDNFDFIIKKFPNIKFIYLYRKDIIKQVVSLYIASYTKIWAIRNKKDQNVFFSKNEIPYDCHKIEYFYKETIESIQEIKKIINKHKNIIIQIEYEEIKNEPLQIVNKILTFFNKKTIKKLHDPNPMIIQKRKETEIFCNKLQDLINNTLYNV